MRAPLRPIRVEPQIPRAWDLAIVVVTVVSLVNLAAGMALADDPEAAHQSALLDLVLCGVLLADVAWRTAKSDRPLRFLRRHIWDVLGAVPLVGPLRVVRVIRVVRILALLSRLRRLTGSARVPAGVDDIAVTALFAWLGAAALFYVAEQGKNPGVREFGDALWWSMTTLSTVGYGDMYPASDLGRLIAGATMVVGVGVLGTLAATIASWLVEMHDGARRGARRQRMKDHLLLLGWNSKSAAALDELRRELGHDDHQVCIVADLERSPVDDPQVRFVRGRPLHREALLAASAGAASAAMIFAEDSGDPRSDHATALVALALRRLSPSVRISAELVDGRNREHLEAASCDGIVDAASLGATLLARAVYDGGVADVVADLVTNARGSELYRVPIAAEHAGKSFEAFATSLLGRGACVIGIHRGKENLLAPEPHLTLRAGDEAYVVAHDREHVEGLKA